MHKKIHGLAVVLVAPQMSQNIGAVARAMLNFGLKDLRLVAPQNNWLNKDAVALASGATEVLESARIFSTTEDAIKDLHFTLATTARHRDMRKEVYDVEHAVLKAQTLSIETQTRTGILFGREKCGLHNDDVALCDAVLTIPVNKAFSSLNLAQSVTVIAYEWVRQMQALVEAGKERGEDLHIATAPNGLHATDQTGPTRPATGGELIGFFEHLEEELDVSGFLRIPGKREIMIRNIRNIFHRTMLSEQEVRTLHGIIAYLVKMPPEQAARKTHRLSPSALKRLLSLKKGDAPGGEAIGMFSTSEEEDEREQ